MKFSEKICLKIILKVKKNQGFSLSLEDKLLEKPQGGGQIEPPTPPPVSGLNMYTVWKVSKYGVFSGPYLDTFHTVVIARLI